MTRKEEQDVQFYGGSAIHEYVKKLHLSEAERKIVDMAIATAKQEKPNIKLIQESDALLNKIAEEKRTTLTDEILVKPYTAGFHRV